MESEILKVITILGTRPEIIRLSRVMALLDKYTNHITVHTGQNYDYELNEIFYQDLELRKPDYYLGVDTSSLGHVLGETLVKIEEIFINERPDAVLILGDTNASIAAIMAKRMKIPIYHMEAEVLISMYLKRSIAGSLIILQILIWYILKILEDIC